MDVTPRAASPRVPPVSPALTRQSECLGPVQPAAHCSWQQSVGFVPLQRGQPWQMLLVTAGGAQRRAMGTRTPQMPPPSSPGDVPRMGCRGIPRAGSYRG